MTDINQHVLEIRYKPDSKVLDYRGLWAKMISDHMKLPDWRIIENRADIFDSDSQERAFVGFRNCGFITYDVQTKYYFPDKAIKFIDFLFTLDGFEKSPYIERIGVRSKFCKKYDGSFEDLKNMYTTNYLTLTEKAIKVIDANLLDIGGPLNFKDKNGYFNTMSGPMKNEQMKEFFDNVEEPPAVGLYFDIDYWLTPKKELIDREIKNHINIFASDGWKRFENISKLILGE